MPASKIKSTNLSRLSFFKEKKRYLANIPFELSYTVVLKRQWTVGHIHHIDYSAYVKIDPQPFGAKNLRQKRIIRSAHP